MKLAVRKDTSGTVPGGGFHYMLHPIMMKNDREAALYELMGYVILDVSRQDGVRLIDAACAALNHQYEVALLTEAALKKGKPLPPPSFL